MLNVATEPVKVRMFQAADLTPRGRIDLHKDADNVRIDSRTGNIIVGYGSGALAIIDPMTRAGIGTIALQGHPEGFRIEPTTGRAFVNVVGVCRDQQRRSARQPADHL
jgi:hypothetical protein